ncbi:hypothetical protein RHOER0001_1961 [Rhodococcus erythropolis SK121]|nr:hypothetical protein RHOER0001_1961 [Rhodococcus erythropolis SK121]
MFLADFYPSRSKYRRLSHLKLPKPCNLRVLRPKPPLDGILF